MNHQYCYRSIVAAVIMSIAGVGSYSAETIVGFDSLSHGQVVDDEFFETHGLTISAVNHGGGPNLAVAFDSTNEAAATAAGDRDLLGPGVFNWVGGNIPVTQSLGILLIVQEHGVENTEGFISTRADDQAGNGGELIFEFDVPIISFGFTLVDIENPTELGDSAFVAFFSEGLEVGRQTFAQLDLRDTTLDFQGNNSANNIIPLTTPELRTDPWDKVVVSFGGSGATGGINYVSVPPTTPSIPAPAALPAGIALLGYAVTMRRRRRRKILS